jgi:hypothetical protein
VSTSRAVPGRWIRPMDGIDRANSGLFARKPLAFSKTSYSPTKGLERPSNGQRRRIRATTALEQRLRRILEQRPAKGEEEWRRKGQPRKPPRRVRRRTPTSRLTSMRTPLYVDLKDSKLRQGRRGGGRKMAPPPAWTPSPAPPAAVAPPPASVAVLAP